jgi:hypothetical protein
MEMAAATEVAVMVAAVLAVGWVVATGAAAKAAAQEVGRAVGGEGVEMEAATAAPCIGDRSRCNLTRARKRRPRIQSLHPGRSHC